jgi:hypothetical protein
MSVYNYQKTPVSVDSLESEIHSSSIVTALDNIILLGSSLSVYFRDTLSNADQTTLDTIVDNHKGLPLPENATKPVIVSNTVLINPYTAKTITTEQGTKRLYKRIHGVQVNLIQGNNEILFTIPYSWCKITGLQLVNGKVLDYCDFQVLDSTTGTYSGVPNKLLNQFTFSYNVAPVFHEYISSYDSDVYMGMQLRATYNSTDDKTVGINYILDEVKQ